ncbi:myb-like protein X isoform X1 [Hydra vulgaris]|uniref:myb-like protein X isoform X1 n=1 Tax=Hydra vulgaris TaxID=6087 RepID=UPI001F5FB43B|nr:myb-like protein X [Hydra vulgaris]
MAEDEEASAIESCYLTESHEISHEIKEDNNMVICIEQEINIQNQSLAEDVPAAHAYETEDVLTAHANEEVVPLNLSNKSSVEDTSKAEDNKNNDNLENNNKKQKSPTLHNKTQSPHVFKKSLTADELRSKKRINDSKTKEEERRAAVLQRKKKLEDEEKARKEAIYKRLSANTAPVDASAIRKKYSLSTSNLLQLRKNKQVENNNDKKPTEKQKVMQRPQSSASTSNLLKSKDKIKTFDNKQSTTVTGKDNVARSPTTRLNQRPSTALGISTYDKKTPQSTPLSEKKVKKDKDVERPSTAPKTLKSKSDSTSPPKKNDSVVRPKSDSCPPQHSSTPKKVTSPILNSKNSVSNKSPPDVLLAEGVSDTKKVTKVSKTGIKSSESKASESKTKSKISDKSNKLVVETNKPNLEQSKTKPKLNVKNNGKVMKNDSEANSKAAKTEEEAKKALAEHRRKAKEEAEAKAKADKEKEEAERCRREEEERKLAQQLEQEEALQNALLEELRQEEEERRKKMIEEKEKRERDEKIRLEEEQRLRDEEIERKAKIELEKHLKDQELKEQELDAERIERKKRVEMIMARVSAKRLDQTNDSPTSVQNTVQTEENTYSLEINPENETTNLKVEQSPHPDNLLEDKIHSVSDPLNNTNKTLKNDTLNQVDFPVHLLLDNSDITSNDYNITNTSIVSVITNDEKVGPYHVEVSSNNNTVIQNGDAHKDITESWNKLEHHMKEMQMDTITPSAEEKKLWKIVEGSVDISECF